MLRCSDQSLSPAPTNGLQATSQLMADKVTTVARAKLGAPPRYGSRRTETKQLDRALVVFLGLAG